MLNESIKPHLHTEVPVNDDSSRLNDNINLRKMLPRLPFCILLDPLYATDSCLALLKQLKMGYAIIQKKTVLKTVNEDCESLKPFIEPVNHTKVNGRFNVSQKIHVFNDVVYKGYHLNVIHLMKSNKSGLQNNLLKF